MATMTYTEYKRRENNRTVQTHASTDASGKCVSIHKNVGKGTYFVRRGGEEYSAGIDTKKAVIKYNEWVKPENRITDLDAVVTTRSLAAQKPKRDVKHLVPLLKQLVDIGKTISLSLEDGKISVAEWLKLIPQFARTVDIPEVVEAYHDLRDLEQAERHQTATLLAEMLQLSNDKVEEIIINSYEAIGLVLPIIDFKQNTASNNA